MSSGWKEIFIDDKLFCNHYFSSVEAMNIIVTHTPVVTTLEMQQAYMPFENFSVNIFAFDFSGSGKSGGSAKAFSRESIVKDLDPVVAYIESNFSSNIHLYGNTGIGGMFAQYYATTSSKIRSFAQFACVRYKDTAGRYGLSLSYSKNVGFLVASFAEYEFPLKAAKI